MPTTMLAYCTIHANIEIALCTPELYNYYLPVKNKIKPKHEVI